jgi:hypothetical protein
VFRTIKFICCLHFSVTVGKTKIQQTFNNSLFCFYANFYISLSLKYAGVNILKIAGASVPEEFLIS